MLLVMQAKASKNKFKNVKKHVRNFILFCLQIAWLQRIRRFWLSLFKLAKLVAKINDCMMEKHRELQQREKA